MTAAPANATSLVGIVQIPDGASLRAKLAKIDTNSGSISPYGDGAISEGQSQGLSVSDVTHNIVYFIGANLTTGSTNLIGLNVTSGNVCVDVALPFAKEPFVGVGSDLALDGKTGEVIVVGHEDMKSGGHTVLAWSPLTQQFRKVTTVPGANILVLGATSTFDDQRGILYTKFAQNISGRVSVNMYAIGTREGTQGQGKVEVVETNPSLGHYFSTMKYDTVTDTLVGFTVDPHTQKRAVVRMSCGALGSARTWTIIGDVDEWRVEDGPIIGLSSEEQEMYAIIQPSPTGPTTYVNATGPDCKSCAAGTHCCRDPTVPDDDGACFKVSSCAMIPTGAGSFNTSEPFHLIRMDLKASATVSRHPPLCTTKAGNCPWSLDVI